MIADWFFEKYELIADAPNAITRMRDVVLELAVQGKLVPHDPDEEPAEACLLRLGLVNTLAQDEGDGSLPTSWCRVRFEDVAVTSGGVTLGRRLGDRRTVTLPYLRVANVRRGAIDLGEVKEVTIAADEIERYSLRENDLLMTEGGDWDKVGRASIWKGQIATCLHQNHIFRCRMKSAEMFPDWFERYFNSSPGRAFFEMASKQTTNLASINMRQVRSCPVPFPPLPEQRRIVAKVDELMTLCDHLEAQHQKRGTRKSVLVRASLARFAEAPTPANLGFLFHKSYDVGPADLRQSILTLAVQGKLVPQNPNDGPASELLERLARELTLEQRRRQAAALSPLPAESLQYNVPDSWTWARFRDVAIIASNLVKPDGFLDFIHLAPDNIEKGNGVLLPCRTVRDDKVISSNHHFYAGQIVYSKIRPKLAKVVVVDFDGLCSADMYPIDALIDAFYLQRYMLSESFLVQAVKKDTRVAMPKINQMELNAIAVPVPPLTEQRRIVAKIDQLMALVDELERQQKSSRATASKLLDAVVHELTNRS